MLHDVRQPDSYVDHLMALGPEYGVSTLEDVRNQQGAVVVPQGKSLNRALTERIITHKLIKPLETSLVLDGGLTAQQLYRLYAQSLKNNPDYGLFHESWRLHRLLAKACKYFEQFPLLVQKMTVMRERLPQVFEQGLFTAYISMAIACRMGASRHDCINVFVAGLVHDVGMLHIDPAIIEKRDEYTTDEWRTMQAHTVIGHCILRYVKGLPKSVGIAVLEHHERCDGSGYPLAKQGGDLGMIGQILGMADTCFALYQKELRPKGLGFDALMPILQLNPDIYCRKVFKAMMELIRDVKWPTRRVYQNKQIPQLISRLLLENENINHDYCVLYGIVMSLRQESAGSHQIQNVINMGDRINRCLLSSGMLQSEHGEWMRKSCSSETEDDYVAIERLEIMYREMTWQIKQLKRMIYGLWKNYRFKRSNVRALIRQGLLEIEHYHKANRRSALH